MIRPIQQEILTKLAALWPLAPDVRFGQLIAVLGLLGEDDFGRNLWDLEDDEMLNVIERHRQDLTRRQVETT